MWDEYHWSKIITEGSLSDTYAITVRSKEAWKPNPLSEIALSDIGARGVSRAELQEEVRTHRIAANPHKLIYHRSKNHYTQKFYYCWETNSLTTHTHQLHNFNCRGIHLCNACVSLVSACRASMISQKGNCTTITLGELPPGTKPIHAGKNLRGINFCANACGACICFRANTGKYF